MRHATFVAGPLLATLLLAGCGAFGATADDPAPGTTWTIDAVDAKGRFGTVTVTRGEIVPLPAEWVATDPPRTRAILMHFVYEVTRPTQGDGYGSLDWSYTADVTDGPAIFENPAYAPLDGMVAGDAQLHPVPPGEQRDLDGWLMLPVSEGNLRGEVTLTYDPSDTDLVVHAP